MRSYLLNVPFLLVCLTTFFSVSTSSQSIDLDVNGIKITAKYKAIVRKLGRPISDRTGGSVPCGDRMRTLKYDGLTLILESGEPDSLGLYKVEVTSRKWSVAGTRIGDSKTTILNKFGRVSESVENGKRYLPYFIPDGYARYHLKRNRVSKVEWEFNFC